MDESEELSKSLTETDRDTILSMIKALENLSPDQMAAFVVEPSVKMALFRLIAQKVDSR